MRGHICPLMSRHIEGRRNWLWSLDPKEKSTDDVLVLVEDCHRWDGESHDRPGTDAIFLSQSDWAVFRPHLEAYSAIQDGLTVETSMVPACESAPHSRSDAIVIAIGKGRRIAPIIDTIAHRLIDQLQNVYNPILQASIRFRLVPPEQRSALQRLRLNATLEPVHHFIAYRRIWDVIQHELKSREEYERNLELYEPGIADLPTVLLDIVKGYLLWDWVPGRLPIGQRNHAGSADAHEAQKPRKQHLPHRGGQDSVESNEGWDRARIETLSGIDWEVDHQRGQRPRSYLGSGRHLNYEMGPEIIRGLGRGDVRDESRTFAPISQRLGIGSFPFHPVSI